MVRAKVSRVLMVVDAAVGSARIELSPMARRKRKALLRQRLEDFSSMRLFRRI